MPVSRPSIRSRICKNPVQIRTVLLSFTGILLFAGFIHHTYPLKLLALGGLVGSALVIGLSSRFHSLIASFGLIPLNRKVLVYTIPAIMLGTLLALFTRMRFELTLLPSALTIIAIVAPLIGAMEELIFRGYFQGELRQIGPIFSILCASVLHTLYKLLVILSLSMPLQFDFFFLVGWTFIGGILFGILRELSKNTLPSIMAHAVFDIILYGGLASAPMWVWS